MQGMSIAAGTRDDRFDLLRLEWHEGRPVLDWESDFSRLIDEWRAVEWRSGGKTLLAALGLQFHEVSLCRGLAWLLDPDGGHQLGRRPLEAFLRNLDVPVVEGAPVRIRVEESREDTRADVVLGVGERTIVIEAKVHAGEQPRQADRLHTHWANENLTLLFLTRSGQAPYTAADSKDLWLARAWREVAQVMRLAAAEAEIEPSAGAREFIEAIGAL